MSDPIERQAAIEGILEFMPQKPNDDASSAEQVNYSAWRCALNCAEAFVRTMPSAHPVHNTTLEDVLTYIDGLDEEHWQELVSCLECRGLTLESHSHSWCGQGGFA